MDHKISHQKITLFIEIYDNLQQPHAVLWFPIFLTGPPREGLWFPRCKSPCRKRERCTRCPDPPQFPCPQKHELWPWNVTVSLSLWNAWTYVARISQVHAKVFYTDSTLEWCLCDQGPLAWWKTFRTLSAHTPLSWHCSLQGHSERSISCLHNAKHSVEIPGLLT